MKKIGLLIVVFLTTNYSFSQDLKLDDFESQILDCIYLKYDSIGLNFKLELLKFEDYLIETNQLKDNSGKSYTEIFKKIKTENKIPLFIDLKEFTIDKNNTNNFHFFSKCFYSKINNEKLKKSNSKIKSIYNLMKSNSTFANDSLSNFAKGLLMILNENDLEEEFYRIWALNTFYFTADVIN